MKLCRRAVEFNQIINEDGAVRICGWLHDAGVIGYLTKNSMEEIYHSAEANLIREMHARGDYSNCDPNLCPYVANNEVEQHMIEIDDIPRFPYSLFLAYENVCNYRCIMCGVPNYMANADICLREEKLNRIDAEIRKVLPHVRHISANGLGELFASRHTLGLLGEWEPEADASLISASLETNGSLFNKQNWEKISNLGKYNLTVSITVLSFENDTYQKLSGTDMPVDNLIENLHFVKSLRKSGIINKLNLATVYQEQNFRQMPEFTRRCLEEFEADYVRLRPFNPWGGEGLKEWFMDVRNSYHPYNAEFLEVMKDPIFKHPKVHDWGGGKPSGLGPEPYKKMRSNHKLIEQIASCGFIERIKENLTGNKIVIYAMTTVGKTLINRLRNDFEIPYCLDKKMEGEEYEGIPLHGLTRVEDLDKDVTVIIALNRSEDVIESMLRKIGYKNILKMSMFAEK